MNIKLNKTERTEKETKEKEVSNKEEDKTETTEEKTEEDKEGVNDSFRIKIHDLLNQLRHSLSKIA